MNDDYVRVMIDKCFIFLSSPTGMELPAVKIMHTIKCIITVKSQF